MLVCSLYSLHSPSRLLPDHLTDMPSLVAVKDLYRQSFQELLQYEDSDDHHA